MVWCLIQAMTAASARCSMGMLRVQATVPLPTGVACSATARASRLARSACSGRKGEEGQDGPDEILDIIRLGAVPPVGVRDFALGILLGGAFGLQVAPNPGDGRRGAQTPRGEHPPPSLLLNDPVVPGQLDPPGQPGSPGGRRPVVRDGQDSAIPGAGRCLASDRGLNVGDDFSAFKAAFLPASSIPTAGGPLRGHCLNRFLRMGPCVPALNHISGTPSIAEAVLVRPHVPRGRRRLNTRGNRFVSKSKELLDRYTCRAIM